MTTVPHPDTGKVWEDQDGGQHYLRFSWRGIDYQLSRERGTRRINGRIYARANGNDGSVVYSDADGNFL